MTAEMERAAKAIDLFDAICNVHDASVSAYDRRVRAMAKVLEAAPSPSPAPGVVEALRRINRYIEIRRAKPLRGSSDTIHGLHTGTEFEAELLLSDLSTLASLSQPAKGEREGGE